MHVTALSLAMPRLRGILRPGHFNTVNLNDEPFYAYHGSRRYNSPFEQYGRTYELGFEANF